MAKNTHEKIRPSKYNSPFYHQKKVETLHNEIKTHIIINKVMYKKILKKLSCTKLYKVMYKKILTGLFQCAIKREKMLFVHSHFIFLLRRNQ